MASPAARKPLSREIRAEQERQTKAKAVKLAAELKAARKRRDEALESAAARCRAERLSLRERLQARRAAALAELRAVAKAEHLAARTACDVSKGKARSATMPAVERAKRELEAERAYLAEMRRLEAAHVERRASLPRTSRAERQDESDDAVRTNLSPELVPLFEKVKRSIKASPRMSRTEAFLHYAEEHPGEVLASLDHASDRLIRELEERQAKEAGAARRKPAYTRAPSRRKYTADELADVPF